MRTLHNLVLTACAFVLLSPAVLSGGSPPRGSWDYVHGLPKGQPIHLTYTNHNEFDATFVGFTVEDLLVTKGVEELRIPKATIDQIEIPSTQARVRHTVAATAIGLVAGAVSEGVRGNHLGAGEGTGRRAAMVILPGAVAGAFGAAAPARETVLSRRQNH